MKNRQQGGESKAANDEKLQLSTQNRSWIPLLGFSAIVGVTSCAHTPETIEDHSSRYLGLMSGRVAEIAAREGIPVEPEAAITAAYQDGVVIFLPSTHEDGRLVGWLDLPSSNACASKLPPGYYVVEPKLQGQEVAVVLRELGGKGRLDGLRSRLERRTDYDDRHPPTLLKLELGPGHFSSWGWFKCSDGVGCCRWALTLDESTPSCQ